MLDLTKLEAGKVNLHLEQVNLKEVLDEAITITKPIIEKKHNTLEVAIAGELGICTTDVTKLRQILVNLLSNAGKFTEAGKVILKTQRLSSKDGDIFEVRVKDTGIGMNEAEKNKIFHAFTQADASTTRRFGGFGLGLTISKEYCKMLGGSIEVQSEPGQGSEFIVKLPVISSDDSREIQSRVAADVMTSGHVA